MGAVKIEKLVFGGYGLGRGENGVVLIPGTVSGELVEYAPDGMRGGVNIGRVLRIAAKSPNRRETVPCPHTGECGGCDWTHLSYDEQTRCKKEIFLDCIDRIGKFDRLGDVEIFTADEFGYRIRAQIKIDRLNKAAGFFRRRSRDIVKINGCPLLAGGLNDVLAGLNSGMLEALPDDVKDVKALLGDTAASSPVIDGLTSANTEIDVAGIKFWADGGSFFQSNKFLLKTLGKWADGYINSSANGGYCLDLYGGIGFFSLMLADNFADVVLADNIAAQVRAANRNFRINGKNHCKAILADVEKDGGLNKLTASRRPDCIIVDPPRPGLTKIVRKRIIDAAPPVILYISCNPSTFARDAGTLIRYGRYKLSRWALFDLYPNTHHIESAAIFYKKC